MLGANFNRLPLVFIVYVSVQLAAAASPRFQSALTHTEQALHMTTLGFAAGVLFLSLVPKLQKSGIFLAYFITCLFLLASESVLVTSKALVSSWSQQIVLSWVILGCAVCMLARNHDTGKQSKV